MTHPAYLIFILGFAGLVAGGVVLIATGTSMSAGWILLGFAVIVGALMSVRRLRLPLCLKKPNAPRGYTSTAATVAVFDAAADAAADAITVHAIEVNDSDGDADGTINVIDDGDGESDSDGSRADESISENLLRQHQENEQFNEIIMRELNQVDATYLQKEKQKQQEREQDLKQCNQTYQQKQEELQKKNAEFDKSLEMYTKGYKMYMTNGGDDNPNIQQLRVSLLQLHQHMRQLAVNPDTVNILPVL